MARQAPQGDDYWHSLLLGGPPAASEWRGDPHTGTTGGTRSSSAAAATGRPPAKPGQEWRSRIIPAATVALVASSMRMKLPVLRLRW